MQPLKIILDVADLLGIIKYEMKKLMGPESNSNNYKDLLEMLIYEQTSPYVDDRSSMIHQLTKYGIKHEDAVIILSKLSYPLSKTLNNYIDFNKQFWYDIQFITDTSVMLIKKKTMANISDYDVYQGDTVEKDFINDYLPERLRGKTHA